MFNFFKKKKLPKTFCIAPFVNMDLHEQGHVNACCKAKDNLGYWSKKKISEIWNDQPIQNLRKRFIQGEKPRGCKACWDQENKGLFSRRLDYNMKFFKSYNDLEEDFANKSDNLLVRPLKFQGLDIGFGAQCGLRCRMCGPKASSSWLAKSLENKEVYKYFSEMGELDPRTQSVNFKDFLSEELFQDFCEKIAPNVQDLMINGGEPLNSKQHFRFFSEMLTSEQLNKLKVSLTTNAQSTEYKGQSLIPYWKQLRRFVYRISIDNVGDRYNYIREGGDFKKVIESISKVRSSFPIDDGKLKIELTVAISLYNIESLPDLIRFSIKNGIFFHSNWVRFPEFLSVENTPQPLVESIIKELQNINLATLCEWREKKYWSLPLSTDKEYESYKEIDFIKELEKKRVATYKDLAIYKISGIIQETIKALNKTKNFQKLPEEFMKHVELMDKINESSFAAVYPRLSQFL